MIYISTACKKEKDLEKNLKYFERQGFCNIELSGNTEFNNNTVLILNKFKKKNFKFLIHNYFPVPRKSFMLNLGSPNKVIENKSLKNCLASIKICKKLNIKKFSLHAPFLVDFNEKEAGKKIKSRKIFDKEETYLRFAKNLKILKKAAKNEVKLYVENNVLTIKNYLNFECQNPLTLTSYSDYLEMKKIVSFKPLIDIAHLKVSSKTLGFDFNNEFNKFSTNTDFFHVSNNNGIEDQNLELKKNSIIYKMLKKIKSQKTFSIEVYSGTNSWKNTYNILSKI